MRRYVSFSIGKEWRGDVKQRYGVDKWRQCKAKVKLCEAKKSNGKVVNCYANRCDGKVLYIIVKQR